LSCLRLFDTFLEPGRGVSDPHKHLRSKCGKGEEPWRDGRGAKSKRRRQLARQDNIKEISPNPASPTFLLSVPGSHTDTETETLALAPIPALLLSFFTVHSSIKPIPLYYPNPGLLSTFYRLIPSQLRYGTRFPLGIYSDSASQSVISFLTQSAVISIKIVKQVTAVHPAPVMSNRRPVSRTIHTVC
jgi:hypothetical protein